MSHAPTSMMTLALVLAAATPAAAQSAEHCFLGATESRYGDGARIQGSVGTNQAGGLLHLGRRSVLEAGAVASADTVRLGPGSQVAAVAANVLEKSKASVGQETGVQLPLVADYCPVPGFTCGGEDVLVRKNKTLSLPPGSYGAVVLQNGADLLLEPGTYDFCSLRGGRKVAIVTGGETLVNVQGAFELGNGSRLGPASGGAPTAVNVGGGEARVGAKSRAAAVLSAPTARLQLGRGVEWRGTFCATTVAGSRRLKLDCDLPPATTTTTTSTTTTSTITTSTTTDTTPSTTSTTAPTSTTTTSTTMAPSSTTTSVPPTSTTAAPTTTTSTTGTTAPPTTTTTTTPTTTTTTTTLPGPLTCGPGNVLDVTATLVYEPRIVGGVFGMFLEVDYPVGVSIPGSGTAASARARFTNLIGANYRFVPQDLDSNTDGVDERGRTLVTANTSLEIPNTGIERIQFDCPSGTVVQPAQFACRPTDLSDSAGMLFPPEVAALVSCSLAFAVP